MTGLYIICLISLIVSIASLVIGAILLKRECKFCEGDWEWEEEEDECG